MHLLQAVVLRSSAVSRLVVLHRIAVRHPAVKQPAVVDVVVDVGIVVMVMAAVPRLRAAVLRVAVPLVVVATTARLQLKMHRNLRQNLLPNFGQFVNQPAVVFWAAAGFFVCCPPIISSSCREPVTVRSVLPTVPVGDRESVVRLLLGDSIVERIDSRGEIRAGSVHCPIVRNMDLYAQDLCDLLVAHPDWVLVLRAYVEQEQVQIESAKSAPVEEADLTDDADPGAKSRRKTFWLRRIQKVPGVAGEHLAPIHGKLISYGLLKFNLQGRDRGIEYTLTSEARILLQKLGDSASQPAPAPADQDSVAA